MSVEDYQKVRPPHKTCRSVQGVPDRLAMVVFVFEARACGTRRSICWESLKSNERSFRSRRVVVLVPSPVRHIPRSPEGKAAEKAALRGRAGKASVATLDSGPGKEIPHARARSDCAYTLVRVPLPNNTLYQHAHCKWRTCAVEGCFSDPHAKIQTIYPLNSWSFAI